MSESTPFTTDFESDGRSSEELYKPREKQPVNTWRDRINYIRQEYGDIILLVSVAINVVAAVLTVSLYVLTKASTGLRASPSSTDSKPDMYRPFDPPGLTEKQLVPIQWAWDYVADTMATYAQVNTNWDNLNPDLGKVSIPHSQAEQWGLESGLDDPSDPSKAVYTLQAYHSMHCLKIVRHTMFQLVRQEPLDVPFGHSLHCLGGLLSDVLCHADTTLRRQEAEEMPTDGQIRVCRNWPALREWASERTTCMVTNSSGVFDGQDFENCRKDDGVLLTSWPGHGAGQTSGGKHAW